MSTRKSIEKAAQAWCSKETKHLAMIPELAKEFAKILDRENILRKIKKDKEVSYVRQDNVAMTFKDEFYHCKKKYKSSGEIHTIANRAAKNFLDLLIRNI